MPTRDPYTPPEDPIARNGHQSGPALYPVLDRETGEMHFDTSPPLRRRPWLRWLGYGAALAAAVTMLVLALGWPFRI